MRRAAPPRDSRWRRLGPVAALVAAAALAARLVAFSVSLSPLGVHPRGVQLGAARAQLLVDNADSAIADINPSTQYQTELGAQLALNYALFLRGDGPTAAIGAQIGLGTKSISDSGPFTLLLDRTNYGPKAPALPEPHQVNHSYRLLTDVDGVHPILSLYAQAPTVHAAVAIIEAAQQLLQRHLAEAKAAHPLPSNSAVVLRSLGPTTSWARGAPGALAADGTGLPRGPAGGCEPDVGAATAPRS